MRKKSMAICTRPKCFRTKKRKTDFGNTSQGKCTTPNPWILFRIIVKGKGFSPKLISYMYKRHKARWNAVNAAHALTPAARRQRMNDSLCDGIALTRFFPERPVPPNWSLNAFIRKVKKPLTLRVQDLKGGISIEKVDSFERFKPGVWFNDTVVNAFFGMLRSDSNPSSASCVFMPTYFYTKLSGPLPRNASRDPDDEAKQRYKLVKRWTSGVDTLGKEKIFIPVNLGNTHWILVYVDVRRKRVLSLDSFNAPRYVVRRDVLNWIEQEHRAKRVPFDRREWASLPKKAPTQTDGHSCGPFVCLFAAFLSNNRPLSFKQARVPAMRERIVWSILNGRLV